jgi:hypothetical protein
MPITGAFHGVAAVAAALGMAALAAIAAGPTPRTTGTPLVEANPRFDMTSCTRSQAASGRVVLVLGTSSPLTRLARQRPPSATRVRRSTSSGRPTGDAREDLVLQFTFTGPPGHQRVRLQGPDMPNDVGTSNTLVDGHREVQGLVGDVLGSPDGIQLFAGPRSDPFFIDLEAFFRVLPDRRPEAGPLSQITQGPLTFRPAGSAVVFLRGINDLAIVVELPISELTANGAHPRFGVWGTASKARGH